MKYKWVRGYHIEDPGPSTCDNQKPLKVIKRKDYKKE